MVASPNSMAPPPTPPSECAIPNKWSIVGLVHLEPYLEIQEALQRLVLALIWPAAVFFPKPDHRDRNSHPFSQFGLFKPALESCCVNAVTERFQACRERFSRLATRRNMAAR